MLKDPGLDPLLRVSVCSGCTLMCWTSIVQTQSVFRTSTPTSGKRCSKDSSFLGPYFARDLPVDELINANYTFMNSALAELRISVHPLRQVSTRKDPKRITWFVATRFDFDGHQQPHTDQPSEARKVGVDQFA